MHYMAEMASKYASCTLNSGMYNKFVCAYMYIYMYIYLFVSVPAFLWCIKQKVRLYELYN